MSKSILVTGGAGFLGSHLCDALIGRNDSVTCLDNFSTGSRDNISHLMDLPNFTVIDQNVETPFDVEVDVILNLACPASPVAYQKDPISTVETAVFGAMNALKLSLKYGARVFQASTSEVYGDAQVHPQSEGYWGNVNPIGIRACYDEGKRCAETLFFDYNRQHAVDIRVGRIFNTYGPRMQVHDGRVVSNFIVQALRNDPITIYGTGEQTRSFCYVDDLVEGILRFVDQDSEVGPVNIGNPNEATMHELAATVCKLTGSKSEIKFMPLPQDDPVQRNPNISKITKLVDWQPRVALEDGLKETISYFKSVLR
jgi:UDP-glucuronate decarboxylase